MAKFKRILLKLSGESLMGRQSCGIDPERLSDYAKQIKEVHENTFLVTIAKDVTIKIAKESVYADAADAQQAAKDAPAEKK